MKFRRALSLLIALCLLAGESWAQVSPYRAQVPVSEQSPAEFKRAAGAGLGEVLARVSGNADVAAQPALRDALGNGDRYVDQYKYQHGDDGALALDVQFAPATIASLLRGAGVQGASPNLVSLRVEGVENFDDYAQLLASLNQVGNRVGNQVAPTLAEGNVVAFDLRVGGGAEQLARQLAAEPHLQALPAVVAAGATSTLSYRWLHSGG